MPASPRHPDPAHEEIEKAPQLPEPVGEIPTLPSPDPLNGRESTGGFSLHHHLRLHPARRLKEGIRKAGIPHSSRRWKTRARRAWSSSKVPAESRGEAFSRVYDDCGIAGPTSGGFRLSPHLYNTAEHVERALAGLKAPRPLIVA